MIVKEAASTLVVTVTVTLSFILIGEITFYNTVTVNQMLRC